MFLLLRIDVVYATFNHLASGVANKQRVNNTNKHTKSIRKAQGWFINLTCALASNTTFKQSIKGMVCQSRASNTIATYIDNNVCLFYDLLTGQ